MKCRLLLPWLAATAMSAMAQPFAEAEAAFAREDYATALPAFRDLAEAGDTRAQTHLGLMYLGGKGVAQDTDEAMRWFLQAAEKNEATAELAIGLMYLHGHGGTRDRALAEAWIAKAAAQGNLAAIETQMKMSNADDVLEEPRWLAAEKAYRLGRYAEAAALFAELGAEGHARARFFLAGLYHSGHGVLQSKARSHALAQEVLPQVKALAEAGDGEMQLALYSLYHDYWGDIRDEKAAQQWLDAAEITLSAQAEAGNIEAQSDLALLLWHIRNDPDAALPWLEKAAAEGDALSQWWLGNFLFRYGDDREAALQWLSRAAAQGQMDATLWQSLLNAEEDGARYMAVLREAAANGLPEAMFYLSQAIEDESLAAFLTTEETGRSRLWLEKAARHGHGEAQWLLAERLQAEGNPRRAQYWQRRAAQSAAQEATVAAEEDAAENAWQALWRILF